MRSWQVCWSAPSGVAWGQCNENDATHEYFNGEYTAPDRAVYGGPEYQFMEPCVDCEVAPGWTPWRDSWGDNCDFYFGPYTPAPEPDPGIDCETQELVVYGASCGTVKQFQLEEGKSYKVHIWIKTGNSSDSGPGSGWVEFGFSKNGQTNNNDAAVAWDIQAKQPDQLADWGVWHEYIHIDELVMDEGDTASLWLKTGSGGGAGITADYDFLWFEEVGGTEPTCYDLPEMFDGPYASGVMEGWKPRNLSGGTTQFREEAPGVTGSAQRLASQDSLFGVVKLFTVPTNETFTLQVSAKTASLDGTIAATPGAILSFGYDLTGNDLDVLAETIVWNSTLNADPEGGFDTWLDYQLGPITSDNDCIAVWLWCDASGQFETQGVLIDFDDLQIVSGEPRAATRVHRDPPDSGRRGHGDLERGERAGLPRLDHRRPRDAELEQRDGRAGHRRHGQLRGRRHGCRDAVLRRGTAALTLGEGVRRTTATGTGPWERGPPPFSSEAASFRTPESSGAVTGSAPPERTW